MATPAEVAAYLVKPEATLRQWRYLRVGPKFYKLGRRGEVRYRWEDVDKWLADEQAKAAA